MFEVWFQLRDDWNQLHLYKCRGFMKNKDKAIAKAKRLGHNSMVKRYGEERPIFINNTNLQELL